MGLPEPILTVVQQVPRDTNRENGSKRFLPPQVLPRQRAKRSERSEDGSPEACDLPEGNHGSSARLSGEFPQAGHLRELLIAFHVCNLFLVEIGACSIAALSFLDQFVALAS